MTEPASSVAALPLTAGLAAFLSATGIDPRLLFAGLAGGWWALTYVPESIVWPRRLLLSGISALAGAYAGHPGGAILAAWAANVWAWWPAAAGAEALRYLVAMIVGLLAHRHIGPLLMRKAEEAAR